MTRDHRRGWIKPINSLIFQNWELAVCTQFNKTINFILLPLERASLNLTVSDSFHTCGNRKLPRPEKLSRFSYEYIVYAFVFALTWSQASGGAWERRGPGRSSRKMWGWWLRPLCSPEFASDTRSAAGQDAPQTLQERHNVWSVSARSRHTAVVSLSFDLL